MFSKRFAVAALLVGGIALGQAIVYGPSLVGQKILLPVDILAQPNRYLPQDDATREIVPHNSKLSDQVYFYELARRFAADELRAGRWPSWNPLIYCGVPNARDWTWSLPVWLYYLIPGPYTLAWMQMLKALIAGVGAFWFFRRALDMDGAPALVAAWAYPLTGFLVLWQGYTLTGAVIFLPWVLLATDETVHRPTGWGGPGLALASGLSMLGGQAGPQVLLAAGIYGAWRLADRYLLGRRDVRALLLATLATAGGWSVGLLMSSVQLLPLFDYLPTTVRMVERSAGEQERPPTGLEALPQIVLPEFYGSSEKGDMRIVPRNRLESSAATYTGLLATLWLAPLAWCSRRHRAFNWLWLALGLFALSWQLNLPGMVALLRLPGLAMLPHNRFVFVTSFAILAAAVVGLQLLWRGEARWSRWQLLPLIVLVGLGAWCLSRSIQLPEPIATELSSRPDAASRAVEIAALQQRFSRVYLVGAGWCALALLGWSLAWLRPALQRRFAPAVGLLLLVEMLGFARGVNAQSDPALYYPPVDVLEQVAATRPGRALCVQCLPANLNQRFGLSDIRGYDGADPGRLVDLLEIAGNPNQPTLRYARTQWYVPQFAVSPPGLVRVSPVLDMLALRSLIFRGRPPDGFAPQIVGEDYWVLDNPRALPRIFVPRSVQVARDGEETLARLARSDFDPRQVAYVSEPLDLPDGCRGTAELVEEVPTELVASVRMETAGLVVLADAWYEGWQATVDGDPAPIHRTNHALRGVVVPAGEHTLRFRYAPAGLRWGVRLSLAGVLVTLVWAGCLVVSGRKRGRPMPKEET